MSREPHNPWEGGLRDRLKKEESARIEKDREEAAAKEAAERAAAEARAEAELSCG